MRLLEGLRAEISNEGERYTCEELAPEDGCARRQRELSTRLIGLVDVLYALVLVQGAVAYRSLFLNRHEFLEPDRFIPVVLALALVFFTAIHSFIDYHFAAEDQPYQFLDRGKRRWDLLRFYLDILIVGFYSFILLKAHVLVYSPAGDLVFVFFAFPVLFSLYILWGALRSMTAPGEKQRYDPRLLFLFLLAYGLLAIAYLATSNGWLGNSEFLAVGLGLMGCYRWVNWRQNRWCTESLPGKAAAEEEHAAEGEGARA